MRLSAARLSRAHRGDLRSHLALLHQGALRFGHLDATACTTGRNVFGDLVESFTNIARRIRAYRQDRENGRHALRINGEFRECRRLKATVGGRCGRAARPTGLPTRLTGLPSIAGVAPPGGGAPVGVIPSGMAAVAESAYARVSA